MINIYIYIYLYDIYIYIIVNIYIYISGMLLGQYKGFIARNGVGTCFFQWNLCIVRDLRFQNWVE